MSLDLSTLTPRELEIYAAGYTDAAADKRAELARADAHLAQAAADLARANSDADRYYRAAFNPRPVTAPGVPLDELEKRRAALYELRGSTTGTPAAAQFASRSPQGRAA
jgi:hypothetical protein